MLQKRTLQGELIVTLFADQIREMDVCGLALWKTPGAGECYMAEGAAWPSDRCVATVRDVLDAVGIQDIDELQDWECAELFIWI